jgi:class 3 adenylate cyclase
MPNLLPGLRLAVRSLTVLFTDLKGSTELYERTGDVAAFHFVQEHFSALAAAARAHSGAIIKTMGDAIMATFSEPQDSVEAAIEMVEKVAELNGRYPFTGDRAQLKVGIHEGPALAINAEERLDYFGHTVNLAARVQSLARAREVCLTESVYLASGAALRFERAGYVSAREDAVLKGIAQPVPIYRVARP